MPDSTQSILQGIGAALSSILIFLFVWKRQSTRLDDHDKVHKDQALKNAELDKQITILQLKKLDESTARQMVDAVHHSHREMQSKMEEKIETHRGEVNKKLDAIDKFLRNHLVNEGKAEKE